MSWVCSDQEVAKQVGLPWARGQIGMVFPFDERAKAIMLFDGDVLRAATVYTDFTYQSVSMHIASDGSKRWLTRLFLRESFAYPFEQLGVQRVTGLVAASNPDALRFDLHLGFQVEGRMRAAAQDGSDLLVLGMLRQECRHLKEEYGRQRLSTVSA